MLSAVESSNFLNGTVRYRLNFGQNQIFVNSWLPLASYNALNNGVDVKLGSVYNTENLLNMMPIKTAALTLVTYWENLLGWQHRLSFGSVCG